MKTLCAFVLCGMSTAAFSAEPPPPELSGLVPCESSLSSYYTEVEDAIAAPSAGRIVGRFTAYPSFQSEWGIVLFDQDGRFTLRVVEFRSSIWHSAYREVKPGSFARDPAKADHTSDVDEIAISGELATLIGTVLSQEIAAAREENRRHVLDGEIFRFTSGDTCAETWSPESGTRPGQLVAAMASLHTLSGVPTDWLRYLWEPWVARKWRALAPTPVASAPR